MIIEQTVKIYIPYVSGINSPPLEAVIFSALAIVFFFHVIHLQDVFVGCNCVVVDYHSSSLLEGPQTFCITPTHVHPHALKHTHAGTRT